MASIGDGMTQELKDAIKAKHKLVEQMKEEVVHPEEHKQNNLMWKIIIVTSSILLLFLAVHQVRVCAGKQLSFCFLLSSPACVVCVGRRGLVCVARGLARTRAFFSILSSSQSTAPPVSVHREREG